MNLGIQLTLSSLVLVIFSTLRQLAIYWLDKNKKGRTQFFFFWCSLGLILTTVFTSNDERFYAFTSRLSASQGADESNYDKLKSGK